MNKSTLKAYRRTRRHNRIRARAFGTPERPRLAAFRSNRSVYAQLIDDEQGTTIASADSRKITGKSRKEAAHEVGKAIAQAASKKGIEQVVFDRGGFHYQGIVAALADGAREGGLKF